MFSSFVKQVLNLWSVCNRIIPKDWIDLVKRILEPGPQLQCRTWFREEAKIIEQQNKTKGREISKDQMLKEGDYATIERQVVADGHTLDLCHAATLNWDRIEEIKKKIE